MKILYIVPYVPSRIRVRPYQMIRALGEKGHRVSLAAPWSSEAERQELEPLREICEEVFTAPLPAWRSALNILAALPSSMPLQANYCWHPALDRQLRAAVQAGDHRPPFDLIHVEHLRGARYGLSLKAAMQPRRSIPVVWDAVDCISHLFEQALRREGSPLRAAVLRLELRRTRSYEGQLAAHFDRVIVTSRTDRDQLNALAGARNSLPNIAVIPNGVDLEYFQPGLPAGREVDTLVVSGKMSYHANIAMVLFLVNSIMPLVWNRRPGTVVKIVGKDPPAEVRALGRDPRVVVTGTVADIRPYLQRAAVAVAPLSYGAGIQNKVLEALACAAPVVATPQAVSALDAAAGADLLVAENAAQFAGAVVRLLENPDLRLALGKAGREYVERYHRWPDVAERIVHEYEQLLGRSSGPFSQQTGFGKMIEGERNGI
ncbi:MAG TPA: glycosyltransferase [Anaerolineaceae bacterium]